MLPAVCSIESSKIGWRLLFTVVLCSACIIFVDGPVARLFADSVLHHQQRQYAIGAGLLLAPLIVAGIVSGILILSGHAASLERKTLFLGSASAIVSFVLNDLLLKPIFGRGDVDVFLYYPSHYGFAPFHGNWGFSFPSGHMAIVTAFISVMWRYFPRGYPLYIAFLGLTAVVLLVGEWHFVSDLVAGAFLGNATAIIAMDVYGSFTANVKDQRK
jgi:membrane-associated phospholipid phosphatase